MRAGKGDRHAFTQLVRRHETGVRNFLARLSSDRSAADDLAQDVFLMAWVKAAAFGGSGYYSGWLYRIAWTCFLERRRSDQRTKQREDRYSEIAQGPFAATDDSLALQLAIETLDPPTRGAVLLCFVQGMTHSEAASALGMPLGSLKTRVARAKRVLIDALECL